MTPQQIRILLGLAQQKKTRDMAALTEQQRQIQQVDQVISTLDDKVCATNENILPEDISITSRWLGWAGQEKSRLLRSRHVLEQSAETARHTAAKSDAKTRVIDTLLNKAYKHELQENRRRAERMGQEPDK